MNITLVLFRFDPMIPSDVEFAVVGNELPRVPVKANDEPTKILGDLIKTCVNIPGNWANHVQLVTFTRGTNGLTCVYKLGVPNNIYASKSLMWIKYDKLEELEPPVKERDKQIIRQAYHS